MRKNLVSVIFLLLNTLLLSLSISLWWGERHNTLFDNGRWIVGKDTGKFVFYTYKFMFRPLKKAQVRLNHDMAYQEILYREGEGPERRLERLKFKGLVSPGGYLWIEMRKSGQRMVGWRLSRNERYPSGYYRYSEAGDLLEHLPLEQPVGKLLKGWEDIELTLEKEGWRLALGETPLGIFPDTTPRDGRLGFRGSGSTRSAVGIREVEMRYRNPTRPDQIWTEHEDFKPDFASAGSWKIIGLFSLTVLTVRLWRRKLLGGFLRHRARRIFEGSDEAGLTLSLLLLFLLPGATEGFHIPTAILMAEIVCLASLAAALHRGKAETPEISPISVVAFALSLVLVSTASFAAGGEVLGRSKRVTWKKLKHVHPDAYIVQPNRQKSSDTFVSDGPVTLSLGAPFFLEGRAYREQLITVDFFLPPEGTLDIIFQQQSFHNRGDPEGEELPLQRRLLRLSAGEHVPWGFGRGVRRDPSPFYRVHGTLSTREENHVEVRSDGTGARVLLNGEETLLPGIDLLDFGETGFMTYDTLVTLTDLRVEPTAAQSARESSYPLLGILLPLLFAAAVWSLLRFSGGGGGIEAAAAGLSAFFPVAFYLSAALFLGRDNLLFLGGDRFLAQDILLTAAALALLFPVVLFRGRLRGAVFLYNISLLGAFLALGLFFWDRLPAEHELKLKFNREAAAPGELVGKKKSRRPWFSNSRSIGTNNYMWKQRMGGRPAATDKEEGTIRIFTLGGSQAWGSGAAGSRETFDALLEMKLRARGLPVEIFNGGINGAGISKVKQFFKNPLARYHPDILIVDIGLNDSAATRSVKGEERALRHVSALVARFEEFIDLAEKQGVLVVLVLEPMSRETPLRPNREFYERIGKIAGKRAAAVIDAGPVMRKLETDHFVWWDTAHLAPYGHQTLAGLLEPVVAELAEQRLRGASD